MNTSNRRRRARAAVLHREKPPTLPEPLEEELGFPLPFKRKVDLKQSAELLVYDPKLPVAKRKEAVPINEDEQEEEDTSVPGWLSRLRDRRKQELEAKTEGAGKDSKEEPLVLKERVELEDKDGKN